MIEKIIADYMSAQKRLVVPQLGAFIRKDTGEIVFVEFLKKDDQVLTSLVRDLLMVSDGDARKAVTDFVDKVNATVSASVRFDLPGLGFLAKDRNGLLELCRAADLPNPAAPAPEAVIQQPATAATPVVESPPAEPEKPSAPYPTAAEQIAYKEQPLAGSMAQDVADREPAIPAAPQATTNSAPRSINDLYSDRVADNTVASRTTTQARPAEQAAQRPSAGTAPTAPTPTQGPAGTAPAAAQAEQRPAASPTPSAANASRPRTSGAKLYADAANPGASRPESSRAAVPSANAGKVRSANQHEPSSPSTRKPVDYRSGRKKADLVVIIAIIAAVIALGSMIFGIAVNSDPVINIQPTNPIEEVIGAEAADPDTAAEEQQ